MTNLPCPLLIPRIKREKTGFSAKDVQRSFLLVFAALLVPVVLAWSSSSGSTASPWACRRRIPSSEKSAHFHPRLWRPCSSQDAVSTRASVSLMLAQVNDSPPKDPPGRPRRDSSGGSYVEGNEYDSTSAEIEAMGGDSFFLDDFSDDQGVGGSGGIEHGEDWDGIVDDEAHMDFE